MIMRSKRIRQRWMERWGGCRKIGGVAKPASEENGESFKHCTHINLCVFY